MNRSALIKETIDKIQQLPDAQIEQINDFAEFLLSKIEDKFLLEGIQKLATDSKSFDYLKNEEDVYSKHDLKDIPIEYVSEHTLSKDWLRPEEDEAWKDL
jgi:hypothetical protein